MYSASTDERDTMGYFFDADDMAPNPRWNIYSDVLF